MRIKKAKVKFKVKPKKIPVMKTTREFIEHLEMSKNNETDDELKAIYLLDEEIDFLIDTLEFDLV